MQQEFPTQPQTGNDIKEQYRQGPPKPPTEEELQQSKNEQTEMMQKDIEFLRLKKEYHDLQIAIITNDVLLGNRPISSVPGLLGAELSVREIKSQTIMSQFVHEMNIRMEEEAKKKKEQDDKQQEVSAQEN